MPIFITVYITYNVVKSIARKSSGSSSPIGTYLEDLQAWILKFGEYRKIIHTSVEIFFEWLSNKSPPLAAYHAFVYSRLITLNKQPGVRPVGVGETWRRLFLIVL